MNCSLCEQDSGEKIKPSACEHIFCVTCIKEYLKNEIKEKRFHCITCPICTVEYSNETIKKICPTHYDRLINLQQSVAIICILCEQDSGLKIQPASCGDIFCETCINEYLQKEIKEQRFDFITCPVCIAKYSNETIKQICPTHYDRLINLQSSAQTVSIICNVEVEVHNVKNDIDQKCAKNQTENCIQRCPKCLTPGIRSNNNLIVCECRYTFCWICSAKISRHHFKFWNLFGCPIPQSSKLNMQPLKHPNIIRCLMILPKIVLSPMFALYYFFKKTRLFYLGILASIYLLIRFLICFIYAFFLILLIFLLPIFQFFVQYPFYVIYRSWKEIFSKSSQEPGLICYAFIFYPFVFIYYYFYFLFTCKYCKSSVGDFYANLFELFAGKINDIKWLPR